MPLPAGCAAQQRKHQTNRTFPRHCRTRPPPQKRKKRNTPTHLFRDEHGGRQPEAIVPSAPPGGTAPAPPARAAAAVLAHTLVPTAAAADTPAPGGPRGRKRRLSLPHHQPLPVVAHDFPRGRPVLRDDLRSVWYGTAWCDRSVLVVSWTQTLLLAVAVVGGIGWLERLLVAGWLGALAIASAVTASVPGNS